MFGSFRQVWTPVLVASELRADRPVGVRVAGVPLACFRDAEGRPAALLDRCPHRGVALSLGRVELGRLACPFHGWQFDREGSNCHVPWNPDARRELLGCRSFPACELGGQIWVYTGEHPEAPPETDEGFLRPGIRVSGFSMPIEAHWTRVMENMLDWPHLPFVHRTTIGRGMVASAPRARMDIQVEEQPYGFTTRIALDGSDHTGRLDYRFPNMMVLFLLDGARMLRLQVACVPESETRTRMVISMARSFLRTPLLDGVFNWQNRKIAVQDVAVVESSWPVVVPRPSEERSVRTDSPTLRFRKLYFERFCPPEAPAEAPVPPPAPPAS